LKVQLATRVDQALRRRLRVHSAITGRTVEDLVSEALNGYLPSGDLLGYQPGMA
jgi:hypothetical protein